MLGNSRMVPLDQIGSCLSYGWIIVVTNYYFYFGVDVINGPVVDIRPRETLVFCPGRGLKGIRLMWIVFQRFGHPVVGILRSSLEVCLFHADHLNLVITGGDNKASDVPQPPSRKPRFFRPVHFSSIFWTWTSLFRQVLERLTLHGTPPGETRFTCAG
ncbi:hypothetical protein BJX70DRAFT_374936 [Aspergillus crustosus]